MKTCPRCARTYPDAESFCEADGTALVAAAGVAGTAKMVDADEQPIECPVCGGKAEPGELICNFCGARLPVSGGAEPTAAPGPARGAASGGAAAGAPRPAPRDLCSRPGPADRDRIHAADSTR